MNTRYFALVYGIVFLLVGIAGFIPGLVTAPAAGDEAAYGRLFGLFPINTLHNLVHIAFGIWGLVAYRGFSAARTYARGVAIVYGVFVVMGLIPGLHNVFGLVPLHSHDIWLHLVLAGVAAYFGWGVRATGTAATRA